MDLSKLRIVVTGGSGFLGSFVTARLAQTGARNVIVPRSRDYDLTSAGATARLFAETKPQVVFHLAAKVGGIGANRKSPGTFFRDNMAMGLNVLDEARRSGVDKVIVAGTICAYPKFAPIPFREEDLWNGYPEETNAPYGIAKKALLVMAQAYRQEFGSNFVMLFPVNLYGPRDNFDLEDSHVIPAMIRKFIDAQSRGEREVTLWGDGTPTREFLYVDDAANGLVLAAERYNKPGPVNLGAGFEIAMRDLASLVGKLCGYEGAILWDANRPNGQPRRMLDTSRAREEFGFVAKTTFEDGLQKTIAWYRDNQAAIAAKETAQ
jgi:GDP-L-fucose synthase